MPKPAADSDVVAVEKGAFVFRQGEDSRDLYVVQEGEVELLGSSSKAPLARLGPGEPFGELSLLEEAPREFSARAAVACRLVKITPETFAGLLKDSNVAAAMLRRLSRRLSASLATVVPQKAPPAELKNPRFVHPGTGKEFPVPAGEAFVGRADPKSGFSPEIELSGVDPKRSLSRKHARVAIRSGAVFVSEEPKVSNGTTVNGVRLKAGEAIQLASGDKVHFGLVATVFKAD